MCCASSLTLVSSVLGDTFGIQEPRFWQPASWTFLGGRSFAKHFIDCMLGREARKGGSGNIYMAKACLASSVAEWKSGSQAKTRHPCFTSSRTSLRMRRYENTNVRMRSGQQYLVSVAENGLYGLIIGFLEWQLLEDSVLFRLRDARILRDYMLGAR